MAGKVFHVSDVFHQRAKDYCQANGLELKQWIETVLSAAMSGQPVEPVVVASAPARTEPVQKKTLPQAESVVHVDDPPWSRPPFWKSESK